MPIIDIARNILILYLVTVLNSKIMLPLDSNKMSKEM